MCIIAGRQIRDIQRKLTVDKAGKYLQDIKRFMRVATQNMRSKNKVFSFHEHGTTCIAMGNDHKEYEFGFKVSYAMLSKTNNIVRVLKFTGNPHDSKTLGSTLEKYKRVNGLSFKHDILDRCYRGVAKIGDAIAIIPCKLKPKTVWKNLDSRKCRNRTAI